MKKRALWTVLLGVLAAWVLVAWSIRASPTVAAWAGKLPVWASKVLEAPAALYDVLADIFQGTGGGSAPGPTEVAA